MPSLSAARTRTLGDVTARVKETFDSIVTTATVELFASSGVTIVPAAATPSLDRVAVIGFGGGGLRGSLGLGVSTGLLERIALPGREPGTRLHDDWLSEMSNQLLGRVKNRLLRHGVTIAIALPMVLRGLRVELVGASKELWAYPFDSEGGSLCVWLDVLTDPEFTLAPTSDEGLDIPSEGELILF
jgi:chemotaxis protein CheX